MDHGILGDGTNAARFTPVMSKIDDIEYFDAGDAGHALAVKDDGTVWAWGFNYLGQLGKGGVSLNDQGVVTFGPEADSYNPARGQNHDDFVSAEVFDGSTLDGATLISAVLGPTLPLSTPANSPVASPLLLHPSWNVRLAFFPDLRRIRSPTISWRCGCWRTAFPVPC